MAKITPPVDKYHLELTQREVDLIAGVLGHTEGNDDEIYNLYLTFNDSRKEEIKFSFKKVGDGTDDLMLVRK